MATGEKPILFGNLSYFVRREVIGGMQVKVFVERYAEYGQVGYESYFRTDGLLAAAANAPAPVKYLQMG